TSTILLSPARPHQELHSFPTRRSSDLNRRNHRRNIERSTKDRARPSQKGRRGKDRRRQACLRPRGKKPQGGHNRDPRRLRPCHRSEEHTSELQSRFDLVCRLLLEKKKT